MDDKWREAFERQAVTPEGIEKLDVLARRVADMMLIDPDVFFAAVYTAMSKQVIPGDKTTYRLEVLGNHRYLVPVERS